MDNSIINKEDTIKKLLSEEHYFLSLLQVSHSNNFLNVRDIDSVQNQILDILKEKIRYYTKDESSSVKVEVAERIMLSIYYTLGLFLKKIGSIKEAVVLIKNKGIRYLFNNGEKILKARVDECSKLLKYIQETKIMTKNYAYIDSVDYGIPLFFKDYDIDYGSHETVGSIDYPLANDEMKLVGIEYIEEYLRKIALENKFCSFFDILEIEALLKGFKKNSNEMLINIFQLVLTNYLGCILLGKIGKSLEITEQDRKYLKNIINKESHEEFEKIILMAAKKACEELVIEDINLIKYINNTVFKIILEIKNNIKTNTLENVFITLDKSEEIKIRYEDGESLKNSIFRSITEEIRDCKSVNDKIDIIKEEFHSLRDLVDVLCADCIFGDEFIYIFKALEDFELALLLKYVPNDDFTSDNCCTESEKEWHERFRVYLESLDKVRREEIIRIFQGVEL